MTSEGLKTPAPGAYHSPSKIEGPKVSFAGKLDATSYIGTEVRRVRSNPGPGAYKPDFSKTLPGEGGKGITIKSRVVLKDDDAVPGPGSYIN